MNRFGRSGPVAELEERDAFVHGFGLLLERLGSRSVLLNQRRVLLRRLVHLGERLVDLVDPARLLGGCTGNVGDEPGHLLDGLDDLLERGAGLVDEFDALLNLAARIGDQVLDVFRRLRGSLRQLRTSEATTAKPRRIAGAGRFPRH